MPGLQPSVLEGSCYPGRCPGLGYGRAFGAKRTRRFVLCPGGLYGVAGIFILRRRFVLLVGWLGAIERLVLGLRWLR